MKKTAQWYERTPQNNPPKRVNAVLASHAGKHSTLLFGGHANMNAKDDSWLWDGSDWRSLGLTPTDPSKLYCAAAAYDAAGEQIVMFGGYDSRDLFDETWLFHGTNWKRAEPTTRPSARMDAVMAFDPVAKMCILFGGNDGGNALDDTWAWNGELGNWIQLALINSPPARSNAAMATDSARNQILLFGGHTGSAFLGDTWIWDGATSNWIEQDVSGPVARYRHAMAEHASSAQVVLFGGTADVGGNLKDTWTWDGSQWNENKLSTSPFARNRHSMATDSYRSDVVLYGGEGEMLYEDTWEWR